MFIAFLYMFRATMCPSSRENTVPMRDLVFVTVYRWPSGMQGGMKKKVAGSFSPKKSHRERCENNVNQKRSLSTWSQAFAAV